jgi:hypothetical protein
MAERVLRSSLAILVVTVMTACATVYSGTGGLSSPGEYNRITGDYTQLFSASLDKTWKATVEALEGLELTIVKRAKDQLGGRVQAVRADGTEVEISSTPQSLALTLVTIEVGRGDEDASIRIAQEIERRLQK